MRAIITISIIWLFLFSACKKNDNDQEKNEPTYYLFNGTIGASGNSTCVSLDDNLIICGNYNEKISLIKVSKSGEEVWRNDFDAGNMSSVKSLTQAENGEIFICGSTYRNNGRMDVLLVKTNRDGDTVFTKTYGGNDSDYGRCIKKTKDGNILIAGNTKSFGSGSTGDVYLIKLNYDGEILWSENYAEPELKVPYHLLETETGAFIITGTNKDYNNPGEICLLKIELDGTKIWDKNISSPTSKEVISTIELSNSDLLICGQHTLIDGSTQVLVLKTDNLGNTIWEKEFGEDKSSEIGFSIMQNSFESYTVTGTSYDESLMQSDIILFKIDQTGNQVWFKKFGSKGDDWGMNLIKDNNNDILITGDYNIKGSDKNIFLTRTDPEGNFK